MTDQPTPETDAIEDSLVALHAKYPASDNASFIKLCTEQLMAKCRALEIQRAAARADVARLRAALELIAVPMRPDGTYNRDRAACGTLAREALTTPAQ